MIDLVNEISKVISSNPDMCPCMENLPCQIPGQDCECYELAKDVVSYLTDRDLLK